MTAKKTVSERTLKLSLQDKAYAVTALIQCEAYGLAAGLVRRNPELKDYMSKEELRIMMDFYEKMSYILGNCLDKFVERSGIIK